MTHRCPKTHRLLDTRVIEAGLKDGSCGRCSKKRRKECREAVAPADRA